MKVGIFGGNCVVSGASFSLVCAVQLFPDCDPRPNKTEWRERIRRKVERNKDEEKDYRESK